MEDAEEIWEWRTVSMRLTKRDLGRRTISELFESFGCKSEWKDSMSSLARSLLGTWTIFRSKLARSRSHLT